MLVDTDNLVSSDDFQRNFEKFAKAVKKGKGPVAVMKNGEVMGFFVAPDYFEFSGSGIRDLLASRMDGPTVSQEEAEKYVVERMAKRRKK
jgi:hypothetical protein